MILTTGTNVMDHMFVYRLTAQDMQVAMNHHLAERRESLIKQNRQRIKRMQQIAQRKRNKFEK
jgi:hypothetical protein